MATAPNTNSTLYLPDGTNSTRTALSTNIIITVSGKPVGAVQDLSITESREIGTVTELGTDGVIDSAPTKSTMISGSCKRIRFDKKRITEAMGRAFIHVKSQVYPFDLVIIDKQSRATSQQISTVIKNVWIKQLSVTYSASDWIISDSMEWIAEDIFSLLNGGTSSTAIGSAQAAVSKSGIAIVTGDDGSISDIERVVDTGGRRGAMDASGLIDLADGNQLINY